MHLHASLPLRLSTRSNLSIQSLSSLQLEQLRTGCGITMSRPTTSVANKEKNEYIPTFITKKPFWVPDDDDSTSNDYLEHQRLQKEAEEQSRWYDRGKKLGPAATKFRKGACENCGAMTHKTKECLSRPRAKGAKWTGKDIQADEAVQDVKLGWDAKRDRWNGYDASEYQRVVRDFEVLEKLKSQIQGKDTSSAKEDNGNAADDDTKYAEESDMGRQQSTSTRNLRLREDTAKYLLNLDLDSAKYDPKSRSMVDKGAELDQAAQLVAEDEFIRASGDAAEFEKAQRYAWESQERGGPSKIHIQANPTAGEYTQRKEEKEAKERREAQRKTLLEKYGGEGHLKANNLRDAAVTENERYVEYDESGQVKGVPQVERKSKYPEDVYINNHTTIFGSWWNDFKWGYACCYSTVKSSYCTGDQGKQALEDAQNLLEDAETEDPEANTKGDRKDDSVVEDKPVKKRTMIKMANGITEEEMEAYKRQKVKASDPMATLLGKDELIA